MRAFAATAITGLTAQNTVGVHCVMAVEPAFIASACPSTNVMPSAAQTSATQYHVNMHSTATTKPSR